MVEARPVFSLGFNEDFEQLLAWRRDVRTFKAVAIEPNLFDAIISQALTYSPSVGNAQPWRMVRVTSDALRREVKHHVEGALAQSAQVYDDDTAKHFHSLKLHGLDTAPEQVAVFSARDPAEGKGLGRQTMQETLIWSTVMAIHTLWLTARAKGVGLGWISILRPEEMNRILDCPPDWQFVAYLCIGYPEDENRTPDLERARWQGKLPIDQLLFEK